MTTEDLLTEAHGYLRDIRNWTRAAFHETIGEALAKTLDSEKKCKAYQMTDGTATLRDVAKACSMGTSTLVALYNEAARRGLMESLAGGRRRRLFDLMNFGLLSESVDSTSDSEREANGKPD